MMKPKRVDEGCGRSSNLIRATLRAADRASLYLVESLNENGYEFCVEIRRLLTTLSSEAERPRSLIRD